MIGLDSNILVRYLTGDDPTQSTRSEQLIDEALAANEILYLNHVVMCETVWVLARAYGYARPELAVVLEKLLRGAQFEFEGKDALWLALREYGHSGADFADCLIGVKNTDAGCRTTWTFDDRAGRLPRFSAV